MCLMVTGGFRERKCGSEGSERQGMMEREDEEGPEEGRQSCLNTFWARAVDRRVADSRGCSEDEKWKTEKMKRMDVGGRWGRELKARNA